MHQIYMAPVGEHIHRREILRELKDGLPGTHGHHRMHIGVGGMFNLEMAAMTKPDALLLLDANPAQKSFWDLFVILLKECEHPRELLGFLKHGIVQSGVSLEHKLFDLDYLFHDYPAWQQPAAYQHLRQLAQDGKILTADVDLVADRKRSEALGKFLHQKGFKTETCYWSNITDFIGASDPQGRTFHTEGAVFEPGVAFERFRYHGPKMRQQHAGRTQWDGEEKQPGLFGIGTRTMRFEEYPPLEKFLRNVSSIGGSHGQHYMTANESIAAADTPLIRFDGPPRPPLQAKA